jgi:hypothetical protein
MSQYPADIRVNAAFPFPSLVQGSGPITIAKAQGLWTLGYSMSQFAVVSPPPATGYVLVWNSLSGIFVQTPVADIAAGAPTTFASLPASPRDGTRAFITNCSTNTFNAAADGAGTHHVPVWYSTEMANWRVG